MSKTPVCLGCGQGILNMLEEQHPGEHVLHLNTAILVLASIIHHVCTPQEQENLLAGLPAALRTHIARASQADAIGEPQGSA